MEEEEQSEPDTILEGSTSPNPNTRVERPHETPGGNDRASTDSDSETLSIGGALRCRSEDPPPEPPAVAEAKSEKSPSVASDQKSILGRRAGDAEDGTAEEPSTSAGCTAPLGGSL